MKRNELLHILLFIISMVLTFFLIMLATRLSVSMYFLIARGTFYFDFSDVIYSAKAGIAAGVPVGFGSWVLTKIDDNNDGK